MKWLFDNLATIIICVILAAIVAKIIASIIRNKQKGQSSCGCGCQSCGMGEACHQEN